MSFAELRRVREAIRDGLLWELVVARAAGRPEVGDALAALESHGDWLEQWEPAFRPRQSTSKREATGAMCPPLLMLTRWCSASR